MGVPGLTTAGLKKLCEALGCPCIRIDRTWYVNVWTFQICMQCALRAGQPDMLAPGCDAIKRGRRRRRTRVKLSDETLKKELPFAMAELIANRRKNKRYEHTLILKTARDLCERIAAAGFRVVLERELDKQQNSVYGRMLLEDAARVTSIEGANPLREPRDDTDQVRAPLEFSSDPPCSPQDA